MDAKPSRFDLGPLFPRPIAIGVLALLVSLTASIWPDGALFVPPGLYLVLFLLLCSVLLWFPRVGRIEISDDHRSLAFAFVQKLTRNVRMRISTEDISELVFAQNLSFGVFENCSLELRMRDGSSREVWKGGYGLDEAFARKIADQISFKTGVRTRLVNRDRDQFETHEKPWPPQEKNARKAGAAVGLALAVTSMGFVVRALSPSIKLIVAWGIICCVISTLLLALARKLAPRTMGYTGLGYVYWFWRSAVFYFLSVIIASMFFGKKA